MPPTVVQPSKTTRVNIDSSVVIRLVKHIYEQYPSQGSGHLLGLEQVEADSDQDQDQVLDIRASFPYPGSANANEGADIHSRTMLKYQADMIDHLKEVNVDSYTVGWYVSSNSNRFFNSALVDNLLHFQTANPEAVVLVYDVSKSLGAGGLAIKAFRLSPQFLAAHKQEPGRLTSETMTAHSLSFSNVLQELPVTISNSHLVTLYLHTIASTKLSVHESHSDPIQALEALAHDETSFDRLNLALDGYVERDIEGIFDTIDDFHYDQSNYNYYQRQLTRENYKIQQWQQHRRADNAANEAAGKPLLSTDDWKTQFKLPEEPSRLENLLISAQLDKYCSEIEDFGSNITPKMFSVERNLELANL